jgi:MFS family permease
VPVRVLLAVSFVTSVGYGLYLSGGIVYFVRSVGLSPAQVGIGFSAAGLVCLPLAVPIGHLADRVGPKAVTIALTVVQVFLLLAATQVHTFTWFLVVITALGVAERGAGTARGAVTAYVVGKRGRARVSATSRTVFNAGFTLGLLAAGVALGVDTPAAYLTLIVGNAAATAVAVGLYCGLPSVPRSGPVPMDQPRMRPLRDLPYLAVGLVTGLAEIGESVLVIGIPLWIISQTSAPRPLAAWLTVVNTVLVVLLQVRATKSADTVAGAARLMGRAYLVLAAAAALLCLTPLAGGTLAIPLLLGCVVLFTLGELWGEGGRWTLRFDLAPAGAQGQYGGIFGLGQIAPTVVGPTLVTSLPQHLPVAGWLVIAAIFLVGATLTGRAVAWAARTRAAPVVEEPSPAPELAVSHA